MKFWQSILADIFILMLFVVALASCSGPDLNEAFKEKYREDLEKISSIRAPDENFNREFVYTSSPPTRDEIIADMAIKQGYYPYVDIAKFGDRIVHNSNLPNGEVYQKARVKNPSNTLPPDIFEITYNTVLHPPFQRIGIEFDTIQIPKADAYGVPTEMLSKPYLLASRNSMQKSIDLINSKRTKQDVEFSKILIKEKQQLKRRKTVMNMLNDANSIELALLSKDKKKKKEKRLKAKKKVNSLKGNQEKAVPASGFVIQTARGL